MYLPTRADLKVPHALQEHIRFTRPRPRAASTLGSIERAPKSSDKVS